VCGVWVCGVCECVCGVWVCGVCECVCGECVCVSVWCVCVCGLETSQRRSLGPNWTVAPQGNFLFVLRRHQVQFEAQISRVATEPLRHCRPHCK